MASEPIEGFGTSIPLNFAVEQIVPEKYQVSFGPGVDVDQSVSWEGGAAWDVVLKDTLAEVGLFAEVSETDRVRITTDPANRAPLSSGLKISEYRHPTLGPRKGSYPDDLQGRPGLVLAGAEPAPEPKVEEKAPGVNLLDYSPRPQLRPEHVGEDAILLGVDETNIIQERDVWAVFAGSTLEDTLKDWGDEAGWNIHWNSEYTIPIAASAEFRGDFIGAVGELLDSFGGMSPRSENGNPRIVGDVFKGNKVLVITTIDQE
ncbi:TcpQ domain-containing protein [Salipiger sp. PrR003]|uniref:TcpQ domain-containing protein n=1 Tax=Salipiger sp. PrR003 TaxID=2706776 RepID=UPI0013DA37C8|nr:TcpQ domain-containing protein [Salipiger sp. PrR003]NDV52929.1 hypothetical protein [Salipiger sp. PrR003]